MKKKISLIITIIMLLISVNVYAVEGKVEVLGDTTVKVGETKELTVKLSTTGAKIGVISGELSFSENISNVTVEAENGWQVQHNKTNGKINALKAEGAENENFMKIKYTVNSGSTANIKLSNIVLSTIAYTSENLADIEKNITVEEAAPAAVELTEITIGNVASKTTYTEGEKVDTTGLKVIAKYSDGTDKEITNYTYTPSGNLQVTDKKVEISYTEGSVTKTVSYDITVNAKKEEPAAVELTEITISNKANKTTYTEGEKVDTTGLKVIAKYSDGTDKEITNYTYTPSGNLQVTDKKVEISYTEGSVTKKASYDITVNAKKEETKEENKKDETVSGNNKLPQTGSEIVYVFATLMLVASSIIFYTLYKRYRQI